MPPEEQALVQEAPQNVGIAAEMQFDNYVVAINWYNCPEEAS